MPSGAELQQFEANASQVLTDPQCAFAAYREELRPFEELLANAAKQRGLPGSFSEGAAFLDTVIAQQENNLFGCDVKALVAGRDALHGRVPVTVRWGVSRGVG